MKLSQTSAIILERIIEAVDTDLAMPGRIGPRQFGTAMPDYIHTELDNWISEIHDYNDPKQRVEGEEDAIPFLTKQRRSQRHRKAERMAKCTAERISRMEQALRWIVEALWDQEARKMLLAYATVKANGWDWGRYVTNRNRRNARKKAWLRTSTYRLIHKSLQLIEQYLLKTQTTLNNEAPSGLRQIQAEIAHKSITSQNYSNREEKAGLAPMKIPETIALASV